MSWSLSPESLPVQIAALTPLDEWHHDAKEEPSDIKTGGECPTSELCVDQYLWSLYQRARKVDTIKVVEQKKASVVKKGKLRTIIQEIVKLVREDFTWKDPAAAEKAGMQQMDYVIGGMDRSFKLRLYRALRALGDAGLGPGITSAFRDDYRQSLASGLKAATNRSYHGGSLRGGYGHGLAADLVSVNGETDAERWDANEKLWNWIDANGKDFGIGRPYLDKDPRTWRQLTVKNMPPTVVAANNMPIIATAGMRSRRYSRITQACPVLRVIITTSRVYVA